jgi:heme exporter protein A
VNAWRGDRHVLRDVTLAVRGGELLRVAGANGSGKTTLLRVLCGLLPAETGEVYWCGAPIGRDRAGLHAELAWLGHSNALKSDLTARENLASLAGLRQALSHGEITAALERAGIGRCADLQARALSAGQRRRLALARVALSRASIWLLDEPTTNVDADGVGFVQGLLREHLGGGGLAVVATHHPLLDGEPGSRRLDLA